VYTATCLGITFNILDGFIQILCTKLQDILCLCLHHYSKKSI
jgi:hypothetical protein